MTRKLRPRTLIESLVILNSNILELLFFIEPSHVALVFLFLFNFKPKMFPKESIVWRWALRESVLLVIIVVSSANWDILTSLSFGRYMPLQFGLWHILSANISTARINKEGLRGHPCHTPLDILTSLVMDPPFMTELCTLL